MPYEGPDHTNPVERKQELNRSIRTVLLQLSQGVSEMKIPKNRDEPAANIARLYRLEDAKALEYLIKFHDATQYIYEAVGATSKDEERGAFVFNETDTRQLQKAIETFKQEVLPKIRELQQTIEKDMERNRAFITIKGINELINDLLADINDYLVEVEIIVSAQPGFN